MFDPVRSREITIVYLCKMIKDKDIETKRKIKKVIKKLIAEVKQHRRVNNEKHITSSHIAKK